MLKSNFADEAPPPAAAHTAAHSAPAPAYRPPLQVQAAAVAPLAAPARTRARPAGGAQGVLTANLLGDDYLGDNLLAPLQVAAVAPPFAPVAPSYQPPVVPAAPAPVPAPAPAPAPTPAPAPAPPPPLVEGPDEDWDDADAPLAPLRAPAYGALPQQEAPPALPPQNVRSGGGLGGRGYGSLLD